MECGGSARPRENRAVVSEVDIAVLFLADGHPQRLSRALGPEHRGEGPGQRRVTLADFRLDFVEVELGEGSCDSQKHDLKTDDGSETRSTRVSRTSTNGSRTGPVAPLIERVLGCSPRDG